MILTSLTSLLFIICAMIFSQIKAQDERPITEITLDTLVHGEIDVEGGKKYYKLIIPSGIKVDENDLAVTIRENEEAENGSDDFSDPDIYVSKVKF